jgi:DNA-directed RNA polymerase subunit H
MNDNFVFIDNIYRSRMTLLDILEIRGYDVEKYRKFSPVEAIAFADSFGHLSFKVSRKESEEKKEEYPKPHTCEIRYIEQLSSSKLNTVFDDIEDSDSEQIEVIVMLIIPVANAHHVSALKQFIKFKENPNEKGEKIRRKLRVSFFSIDRLVINPMNHVLVPKHTIVPEEEHKELMKRLCVTSKSKFPEIKFHIDPIARCIGAVPGDIVKIVRPSPSSGESIIYRLCAP